MSLIKVLVIYSPSCCSKPVWILCSEDILKNVCNQAVPWYFFPTMEIGGAQNCTILGVLSQLFHMKKWMLLPCFFSSPNTLGQTSLWSPKTPKSTPGPRSFPHLCLTTVHHQCLSCTVCTLPTANVIIMDYIYYSCSVRDMPFTT